MKEDSAQSYYLTWACICERNGQKRAAQLVRQMAESLRVDIDIARLLRTVDSLVPPRDRLEYGLFPISATSAAEDRTVKWRALLKESPTQAISQSWTWLEIEVWRRASDWKAEHSTREFEEAARVGGLSDDQIKALKELRRIKDRLVHCGVSATTLAAVRFSASTERLIAQLTVIGDRRSAEHFSRMIRRELRKARVTTLRSS
jgi:plasmid stabilization system protein ParE